MNVNVIWQGQDITTHVIEYTRQHDICTGVGSLDLIVEGATSFDFNPWNSIVVKEEGTQVAIYNITSVEKAAPDGEYIIAAQDNSKRLTDYFLDKEYTATELSKTKYWIQLILEDAGVVDYDTPADDGETVTIGSQFGMRPAYDAILNLLQLSGWFMYFDANGSCQIGSLDNNKTPVHDFYDIDTLQIRTTYSDKMLRNRVYVWGRYDEDDGWVYAKEEADLGWFRDDGEDYRSVVYQNSSIYYFSTAITMAQKILSEFSKQIPEKEMEIVGLHPDLRVGLYIKSLGKFGTGIGQITSYVVNVNSNGATTTLIIDKKCPRLFGISDIESDYIYIGTDEDGVWRKTLDGGYWYAFNTGIETKGIRDLTAYDNILSTVTNAGELYVNTYGSWSQYFPTPFIDITASGITVPSGFFISSSTDTSYTPNCGINAAYGTSYQVSGVTLGFDLPVYAASGNRSWVVGITSNRAERYVHQIYVNPSGIVRGNAASGILYDVGVLDIDTNDLGQNILSVRTIQPILVGASYYGSYNHAAGSNKVLGKNIYNSVPPGLDILVSTYGGQKSNSIGDGLDCYNVWWTTHGDGYSLYANPGYYTPDILFIHENHMEIDNSYIEGHSSITYSIYDWNGEYPTRIIYLNSSEYNILTGNNSPSIYTVNILSESITNIKTFEEVRDRFDSVIGSQGTYQSMFTGSDGDFWIISKWQEITEHYEMVGYTPPFWIWPGGDEIWRDVTYNGDGYVRVINMRSGTHTDFRLDVPTDGGGQGSEYYWEVSCVGWDESLNNVIIAFCISKVSQTKLFYSQEPMSYVQLFVINKYTGTVHQNYINYRWNIGNRPGQMWTGGGMYTSLPGYDTHHHRYPFFFVGHENPDGGYGFAYIHLIGEYKAYDWRLDYFFLPWPHMEYTYAYYGTYYESAVIRVGIPDGATHSINTYVDIHEGHDDTDPPVPERTEYNTPNWLLRPDSGTIGVWQDKDGWNKIDNSFHAFYSRELAAPLVCFGYRTDPEVAEECPIAFVDADNPVSYTTIPYSDKFYDYYEYYDRWNVDCDYSPLADDLDNAYYLLSSYERGTIFGLDAGGNIIKSYRGGGAGHGWWYDIVPYPLGNKVCEWSGNWYGLMLWPGASGIAYAKNSNKILLHDPTVPSGSFTVLYQYSKSMAVEVGMGIPTVIYDPPVSGGWGNRNTNLIGASWTNSGTFPVRYPISNITDARLLDIFNNSYFPLASGETLPDNSLSRFVGFVGDSNYIRIFNTEFENYPDLYSTIVNFPYGYVATHIDFTNFFPSPYIFAAVTTTASGQLFLQRYTEGATFYNASYNLPGSNITIIRADDKI